MQIGANSEGVIICSIPSALSTRFAMPHEVVSTVLFDERTNQDLFRDINTNTSDYTIVNGELRKFDLPITIAPDHPDTWYAAQEAAGITVGLFPGRWAIDTATRGAVTGQFLMASTAVQIGAATADGPFPLTDADNTSHSFTLAQLTMFGLQYGQTVQAILAEYRTRKDAYAESLLPPPEPEPEEPPAEGGE